MPRKGFDTSVYRIIWDGNSLMDQGYVAGITSTSFNDEYGSSHVLYSVAVSAQNVDDMQARLPGYVLPKLSRHHKVLYIVQPGRNQLKGGTSVADTLAKIKTLAQTIHGQVSSTKVCIVLTSASTLGGGDPTIMTDIPDLNDDIAADTSGDFDTIWDLYNNGLGFDDPTNEPPYQTDGVHYSNPTGMNTHSDWIADQCKTAYP